MVKLDNSLTYNHDRPWDLTSVASQNHILEVIKKCIDLARKEKDEGETDTWIGFEHEGNHYDFHLLLDGDWDNKDDLMYNVELYGCSKSEEDQEWYTDTDKSFFHFTFDYNGEFKIDFDKEKEFDVHISHSMSVMAKTREDAVEWVKDHVATQGKHIEFDVE